MWNAIQEESRQVKTLKDASGAVVMPAPDVVRVIKGHVPTDHWKALQLALKNHTMDGVKVVMGTRDEVSAYQLAHYPETVNTNEVRFKGKYDPINRVVYIADLNTETIAHELLHAMTTNKLALYYSNPGKLTSADRDSIQRIEALMDEFLEGSLDFKNRQQQMVFNQLDTKLSSMLMQGKRFQAVSEFISYVLTNQDLVDLARRSKVKNPLGKIIGEALQALKELIWGKVKTAETEIGKSFYQNLRFNVEVLAISREEIALSEGRWGSIIEKLQEKVPESLQPLYRYAALTKDTPIFRALSLATQYGDFLAKAIAYDHLTQVMGKTQKEALGQVTEEFIHYNFYAGRVQGALEANGLAWFMAYKLRSIKVAERTLRNNPLRTMLLMSINPDLPIFVPTGSVVDDNAVTQLMDGSIFRAFGPGMVATAPELNPYYNAFY
jgi:hypothetical protein